MLNERIDKWTDGHRLEGKKWLQGWTGRELAADATALMSSRRKQLAAGGCGDHLCLNQLHLTVHNIDYLMCCLEVRAGQEVRRMEPLLHFKDPASLSVAQNPLRFRCT